MVYYAKSKDYILDNEECEKIILKIKDLSDDMINVFTEKEINMFKKYIQNIKQITKNGHKTLAEHTEDIVRCATAFFEMYGEYFTEKQKQLVILACREHDTGKANYIFQTKVNPELKKISSYEVPHGFLSAFCINKNDFLKMNEGYTYEDFRILITAIYYHHNREDEFDNCQKREFCNRFLLKHLREYKNNTEVKYQISNENKLLFSRRNMIECPSSDVWHEYEIVKGLLNKFDWTVSAGYEKAEFSTDKYEKRLSDKIKKIILSDMRPAQEFMYQNKDNNVVMVAPTGSGKTEAALLWLDGEKGFYTLPLKVSANAIYERIRKKYCFENVALLHSDRVNVYTQEAHNGEDEDRRFEQASLLSETLTVCTVDQIFKFVYKSLGTEIFAATLKYSKVIIDEIQSYSPDIVAALLYGLSEITKMGGKFAVITATFPPVLKHFMKKCGLIESDDYLYKDFSNISEMKRHKIKVLDGDFDVADIVEKSKTKKVLVICNTVSKAQRLYELIGEITDNVGLLHSKFIRKHRDILEKDIMDFSNDVNAVGIWISTQIVEASLDIDFDILYTQMSTADSLLQRMGRCNRAGYKKVDGANIIIYNDGINGIYDKDIYNRSLKFIRKYEIDFFTENAKIDYINEVYDTEQMKDTQYYKSIEQKLSDLYAIKPLDMSKKKVDKEFRNIKSITVMPDKIYDENKQLIDKITEILNLRGVDKKIRKMLKSKLQSFTLSVNLYNKYPEGIDKSCIGEFDIHRTCIEYKFDEDTGRGLGLCMGKMEEENWFI